MKPIIDVNPCDTCDFVPSLCGRDIEDCMARKATKKGVGTAVVHMVSQTIVRYGDYRDEERNLRNYTISRFKAESREE